MNRVYHALRRPAGLFHFVNLLHIWLILTGKVGLAGALLACMCRICRFL